MNVKIYYENKQFSQLLEDFIKGLGYDVVINTDKLSIIKDHISEIPEIYVLECNAKGLQIFDLIDRDKNLVIYITESYDFLSKNLKYKIFSFNHIHKDSLINELEQTLNYAKEQILDNNLFVYRSKYQKIAIPKQEIFMIESASGKDRGISIIYHKNGVYKVRMPLKYIINSLGSEFIRCHRKFIVNRTYVKSLEIKDGKRIIHLINEFSCPCTLKSKEVKGWLCL